MLLFHHILGSGGNHVQREIRQAGPKWPSHRLISVVYLARKQNRPAWRWCPEWTWYLDLFLNQTESHLAVMMEDSPVFVQLEVCWRETGDETCHVGFHFYYSTVAQIMYFVVVHMCMQITFFVECAHTWPFGTELCSHRCQIQATNKHEYEQDQIWLWKYPVKNRMRNTVCISFTRKKPEPVSWITGPSLTQTKTIWHGKTNDVENHHSICWSQTASAKRSSGYNWKLRQKQTDI